MPDPGPGTGSGSSIPTAGEDASRAAALARRIVHAAAERDLWLATAESLTAGAVVARLVDVPGASACIAGGAACYRESSKARVLGVDPEELDRTGAVTESVAQAMAAGALTLYDVDLAVATTGVAGPGPDDRQVPAGTVHLAVATRAGRTTVRHLQLPGNRPAVREGAVLAALEMLAAALV